MRLPEWLSSSGAITGSVAAAGFTLIHAFNALPLRADWSPSPEPKPWQQRRQSLLPGDGWRFVDATSTDQFEAGEYIRRPRTVGDSVELDAGLILKKADQTKWSARVVPMRAVCLQDRLERKDANGVWTPYPGRAGTAVRVRWICSL